MTNHKPTAFHVIVRPDPVEKESVGGIILYATDADAKKERAAGVYGTLVAVGPTAWKGFDSGEPWAKVGDRVMFAKYSGKTFKDDSTDDDFVLLNDEDILAVINVETN